MNSNYAGQALFEKLMKTRFKNDSQNFFESDSFQEMFNQISQALGEEVKPRILLAGKTGAGKSSLLNALMEANVCETGNIPCTKENMESIWQSRSGDIVVIDVPGFGEADPEKIENLSYEDNMKQIARLKAHMAILVVKCDDRALELESKFIKNWKNDPDLKDLPLLIVINQIDKMKPVRKCPVKEKEKNIREFIDYMGRLKAFEAAYHSGEIIPTSAGESHDDQFKYGIDDLRMKIYEKLPDCARTVFARIARLQGIEAGRIIKYYSGGAAAAVAFNPVAGSDALLIAPIQIALIIHLGQLHNIEITANIARSILTSLCSSLVGRFTYQIIISFIPVVKNFLGPGLAFSFTWLIGEIVNDMFVNGQIEINEERIKKTASRFSAADLEKEYKNYEREST
jgi:small GTP-binding protein